MRTVDRFHRLPRQRMTRTLLMLAFPTTTIAAFIGQWLYQRFHLPVRHRMIEGPDLDDLPDPVTQRDRAGEWPLQLTSEGTGPLFHRRYRVDIRNAQQSAEALMAEIKAELNRYCPIELARFEKMKGDPDTFAVGDEYYIHISGPWNGPVRVIKQTPTSFTFVTLESHLEAGQIRFQFVPHPDDPALLRFEILSWARNRDAMVSFAYSTLGIAKLAQTTMWTFFCNHVVERSGGERVGEIDVMTQEVPFEGEVIPDRPRAPWETHRDRLRRVGALRANFDLNRRHEYTEAEGWRIDDYEAELPSEPPGPPVKGGSWEVACDALRRYEFPDPALIQGIYVPDQSINERVMLLKARFLFLTFYFGVRVSAVIDEQRDTKHGPARVWGFSYHTLEGHFEQGEITFEIWKYLNSGDVRFRIHSYSRMAFIRNPFFWIGFKIFGRSLQRRFARTSMERLQKLVTARIKGQPQAAGAEQPEGPPVMRADAAPGTAARLDEAEAQARETVPPHEPDHA